MGAQVSIGDFSFMTGLSRKALRHYHDVGILAPAHIDAHTGYRFYDTSQIDQAQIVRRFRSLGMSIPDIKALLSTGDADARSEILTAHLQRMEQQLQQTQETVAALRDLLSPVRTHPRVEVRHLPGTPVWAVTDVIDLTDLGEWFTASMRRLRGALAQARLRPDGPPGGLYDRALFSDERGRATLFIPAAHTTPAPEPVRAEVLPAGEFAILTHTEADDRIDLSYGALGTHVHENLISHEGPIREHYLDASTAEPIAWTETEICWPVFHTAPPAPHRSS